MMPPVAAFAGLMSLSFHAAFRRVFRRYSSFNAG